VLSEGVAKARIPETVVVVLVVVGGSREEPTQATGVEVVVPVACVANLEAETARACTS